MFVLYAFVVIAVTVALYILFRKFLKNFIKFRGDMIVTCPETKEATRVEVDSTYSALTSVMGEPNITLCDCARWPQKRDCGQECVRQIEKAPENCLVRYILRQWYSGKDCVLCHKPFGELHWHDHKPALLSPDGKTLEWHEIAIESLSSALATHAPVCWNCHIAETFRKGFPELVTERESRKNT